MPKRTKTLTTQAAIRAAFAELRSEDEVEVKFKPLTDQVWLQAEDPDSGRAEAVADSNGDDLPASLLADIIAGRAVTGTVDASDTAPDGEVKIEMPRHGTYVWVDASYLAALRVLPGSKEIKVDGLSYPLVLKADGTASVGCQTLTRKGCEQAFRALAKHLGYEVTD